ncbi:MAG: DUF484 family protein [Proteobacteria bacterium]|nr:DUF484 family protein [Pseudomonadota bacterium]HQR04803.1 DUF484 family protein [Rhodocyclaceae bacterium]
MNEDDVASYLAAHADFFDRHGELLHQIRLPDRFGGSAVSLAERQLALARDKARTLEGKLTELIRYGTENDQISEKVHRLGVALQGASDLAAAVGVLHYHLQGDFAVPHMAVRIWGVGDGQLADAAEFLSVPDTIKAFAGGLQQPYCGFAAGQESLAWFGESAARIRSMAQIPLREPGGGVCFGLLVVASEEEARFYPDMGVLFLTRIGDQAGAALLRVVG